mmetsp:Transcript_28481/g.59537  ORF Transcript_28481/g.59537 Transcript_28481/m.59537 type:complete len:91 (+) Transcript_28481:27-299(+)
MAVAMTDAQLLQAAVCTGILSMIYVHHGDGTVMIPLIFGQNNTTILLENFRTVRVLFKSLVLKCFSSAGVLAVTRSAKMRFEFSGRDARQ